VCWSDAFVGWMWGCRPRVRRPSRGALPNRSRHPGSRAARLGLPVPDDLEPLDPRLRGMSLAEMIVASRVQSGGGRHVSDE